MTRSKRMQPVAHVAQVRQQDAARLVGERQRALDAQIRLLEELHAYRDEYASRFEEEAKGMAGLNVREYRLFLSRLNQAIEEQVRHVDHAREVLEKSHGDWTRSRVHRDAIDKAIDRLVTEERRGDVRREQAENDEFGQRLRHREP